MENFLKFLQIILSWPVAVLVIFVLFFFKFKSAIETFLRNIKCIKTPWGAEIQSQSGSEETKTEGRLVSPEEEQNLQTEIKKLLNESHLNLQQKEQLRTELKRVYDAAFAWKFSYLNLFYVYKTKQVLLSVAHLQTFSKEFYHNGWKTLIQDEAERNTILDVLASNGMLSTIDGVHYKVTDQGYRFLEFIGYLPKRSNYETTI